MIPSACTVWERFFPDLGDGIHPAAAENADFDVTFANLALRARGVLQPDAKKAP